MRIQTNTAFVQVYDSQLKKIQGTTMELVEAVRGAPRFPDFRGGFSLI